MKLSKERRNRIDACLDLFLERVSHDSFDRWRHRNPHRLKTRRLEGQMLLHDRRNRRSFKRNFAREHLVENDSKTINVSARVRLFVGPLFRRHIKRRTHQSARLRLHKRTEQLARLDLRETEVEDLQAFGDRYVVLDHDVQWFQITMYDVLPVRRADTRGDGADELPRALRRHRAFSGEYVLK